jgi:hypothetical protein
LDFDGAADSIVGRNWYNFALRQLFVSIHYENSDKQHLLRRDVGENGSMSVPLCRKNCWSIPAVLAHEAYLILI